MGEDIHSTYEKEYNRINELELEAKQGDGGEFLQDFLFKIDLIARDWAFYQVHGEITVEEHTELIRRKLDLIKTLKERE